jgi:hypothetical protein
VFDMVQPLFQHFVQVTLFDVFCLQLFYHELLLLFMGPKLVVIKPECNSANTMNYLVKIVC